MLSMLVCVLWGLLLTAFVLAPLALGWRFWRWVALGGVLFGALFGLTGLVFGQEIPKTASAAPLPAQVQVPPPFILPGTGEWIPAVNQYVITPAVGQVLVAYTGVFDNTFGAKGTRVWLPFPKDASHIVVQSARAGTLHSTPAGALWLDTDLDPSINTLRATFVLEAPWGQAHWESAGLQELPGVAIFSLPVGYARYLPQGFRPVAAPEGDALLSYAVRAGGGPFPVFSVKSAALPRYFLWVIVLFFVGVVLVGLWNAICSRVGKP